MTPALSDGERSAQEAIEPLALSAPIARRMAERLCTVDPESGNSCSWYHGVWQDLRILRLVATPEHQAPFFLTAFARWKGRTEPLKVLICGAADYAILAQVARACEACEVAADITIVDVCETPLFLNRWYAEKFGLRIATVRCNALEEQPSGRFDVVCSHSFLGQFPGAERARLVGRWLEVLNPHGTAVAVNRVRINSAPGILRFSGQQAQDFRETVLHRARESHHLLQTTPEELATRAEAYIGKQYAFPVTEADVADLFEQAGFRIDCLAVISSAGPESIRVGGPAVPANAQHACVIATKAR
jgi:hypothetical protein